MADDFSFDLKHLNMSLLENEVGQYLPRVTNQLPALLLQLLPLPRSGYRLQLNGVVDIR